MEISDEIRSKSEKLTSCGNPPEQVSNLVSFLFVFMC